MSVFNFADDYGQAKVEYTNNSIASLDVSETLELSIVANAGINLFEFQCEGFIC